MFVSAAAGCIGFTGFTLVMPFLPLYISNELGVTDVGQVAFWTGLTLGATPAVTAISAPLWGRVGDRYGSKLLVVRSLTAFVLTKAAMAFVTAPWQLFALRALLGLFAGYGALTVSMAAESVPRERMASAIGIVQMGQRLGPAMGPVMGGVLAPLVGLRRAFLVAAAFYFVALILVALVYREPPKEPAAVARRSSKAVLLELTRLPGFVLLLGVILTMQIVDRSFGPILPLYVEQIGMPASRVSLVAGVLFSLSALSAAVGHRLADRLLQKWSGRVLIATAAFAAALAIALIGAVPSVWALALGIAFSGVAIGVAMTTAYSSAGSLLPGDAHATGFGLMTTASLTGLAASPVIAGLIGGTSLRIVFALDVVALLVLGWAVHRRMTNRPITAHPPVVSDTSVS